MDETTTEKVSLDDSLTSIQWLCQLESNKLLKNNSHKKRESVTSNPVNRLAEDYNPFQKPQYSYASLIVLAINSTRDKRMTLQSIYTWIEDNFPYYQYAKKGWKNSIRHNLSLHKFFIKEQRTDVLCGKGCYWRISPEGKENLMRDILKPPACNLRPPIALLPHDPNRKLRPILPKPSSNGTGLQYVPLVDYNFPIVLVPSVNEARNQVHNDPANIFPAQMQRNYSASQFQQSLTSSTTATQSAVIQNSSKSMSSTVECKTLNTSSSALTATRSSLLEKTPGKAVNTASKRGTKAKDVPSKRQRSRVVKNSKRVPNILRRKTKPPVKSPEEQKSVLQTPLKNSLQSTLAAINSFNHTPCSPKRQADALADGLTASDSSPFGHNRSFDFLQYSFGSPGISPLRSPVRFSSGFTPLRPTDCEPGNMSTPSTSFLADLSFSWTPNNPGFTPISTGTSQSNSSSTTQRCRKSLGLDKLTD